MVSRTVLSMLFLSASLPVLAELIAVDDAELESVSGTGIGFAVEDFIFDAQPSGEGEGATVSIGGIENTNGSAVAVDISNFYVMGPGSNYGTNGADSDNPATYSLGNLNNAVVLDIYDSSDFATIPDGRTVIALDFPVFENGSRQNLIYGEGGLQSVQRELDSVLETLTGLEEDFFAKQQGLLAKPDELPTIQPKIRGINQELWGQNNVPRNPSDSERGSLYSQAEQHAENAIGGGLSNPEWNNAVRADCGFLSEDCRDALVAYRTGPYFSQIQQLEKERKQLEERGNFLAGLDQRDVDAAETALNREQNAVAVERAPLDAQIANLRQLLTGSNGGADTGISMQYRPDADNRPNYINYQNLHITGLSLEDSFLRLWGDGDGSMEGEMGLQLYANTMELSSCQWSQAGCGDNQDLDGNNFGDRDQQTFFFTNIYFNLNLGYGLSQPLQLEVVGDGNIQLELPTFLPVVGQSLQDAAGMPGATDQEAFDQIKATADDFYANAPESDIYIGNLTYGGTRPDAVSAPVGGLNLGSYEASGISIQYLKVSSYDLP